LMQSKSVVDKPFQRSSYNLPLRVMLSDALGGAGTVERGNRPIVRATCNHSVSPLALCHCASDMSG
jgi:hypothetical protein